MLIFIIGHHFCNENVLDIGLLQTVVCLKSIPHEKPRNAQRITFKMKNHESTCVNMWRTLFSSIVFIQFSCDISLGLIFFRKFAKYKIHREYNHINKRTRYFLDFWLPWYSFFYIDVMLYYWLRHTRLVILRKCSLNLSISSLLVLLIFFVQSSSSSWPTWEDEQHIRKEWM